MSTVNPLFLALQEAFMHTSKLVIILSYKLYDCCEIGDTRGKSCQASGTFEHL